MSEKVLKRISELSQLMKGGYSILSDLRKGAKFGLGLGSCCYEIKHADLQRHLAEQTKIYMQKYLAELEQDLRNVWK